ncbi:MAG: response regulator [Pseudomonadota bacterium]
MFTETYDPEDPGTYVAESTRQVVVVDDSATQISLYERGVDSLAAELSAFRSTDEALEFLHSTDVDLLFLDLAMSGSDGLSFLRDLRALERHEQTNVVIVTSKDYAQDRIVAKELGSLDYMVKPLRSQEIREIICKYTDVQSTPSDSPEV